MSDYFPGSFDHFSINPFRNGARQWGLQMRFCSRGYLAHLSAAARPEGGIKCYIGASRDLSLSPVAEGVLQPFIAAAKLSPLPSTADEGGGNDDAALDDSGGDDDG